MGSGLIVNELISVTPMDMPGNWATIGNEIIDLKTGFVKLTYSKRTIDPSILYTDWYEDDVLPSTDLCNRRTNINTQQSHDALGDAINVIELIRKATNNYKP